MKPLVTLNLLGITFLISLSVEAVEPPTVNLSMNHQKIEWTYLQEEAKSARKSKAFKNLSKKQVKKSGVSKKESKLIKRYRKLTRQAVETKAGTDTLAQGLVRRYVRLENEIDTLNNAGGTAEGKGACMKECGTEFPGTGGGNGANRLLCKLSCLVLGE